MHRIQSKINGNRPPTAKLDAISASARYHPTPRVLQPTAIGQDFFWDDLLEYIEERRVIPIVGAELLTVNDGQGNEAPLMRVLAAQLAARLRVPAEDCTGDDALHVVVCRYLQRGGRREEVYPRIRTLMKELAPAVPPVLRELAKIRHFNLFVTTTFDSLLAQALDDERFAGTPRTTSTAYAPNHVQDLPPAAQRGEAPPNDWPCPQFPVDRAPRATREGHPLCRRRSSLRR